MKRMIVLVGPLVAVAALATAAGSNGRSAYVPAATQHSLQIAFEPFGCHSWSLDGGAFRGQQVLRLRVGESVVVTNHDVCSHTLVEKSGAPIAIESLTPAAPARHVQVVGVRELSSPGAAAVSSEPGAMSFGGNARATFYEPGTYELVTHESDPTVPGDWTTFGPDNQLVLHVQVYAGHRVTE